MMFPELESAGWIDARVETGPTYDGIRPVVVRIGKRGRRYKVTDDGGAVSAAGLESSRFVFPEQIALGRYSVNLSRQGVVWLPAVAPTDEWLAEICDLVSEGSVRLYEHLLELDT